MLYLVFEFMHGGDLYVTAQGRPEKRYTEEESLFIVAEITMALGKYQQMMNICCTMKRLY